MAKPPTSRNTPVKTLKPGRIVVRRGRGRGSETLDWTCSDSPVRPGLVSDHVHRMRRSPYDIVAQNQRLPPSTCVFFPAVVDATVRHHTRPLMAPRARATTVTDRPRTSSGPDSARPSGRVNLDNRISRDDSALSGRTFERANYKSSHIPTRAPGLSPKTSPKTQSQNRVATTRIMTPTSMDGKADSGVIAIGMALGSPAHPPAPTAMAPWQPQPQFRRAATSTAVPDVQTTNSAEEDTKTKTRKWGLFRSKSKRAKAGESAPKRPNVDVTGSPALGAFSPSSSRSTPPAAFPNIDMAQSEQDRRKVPKHKPIVVRSQTEPMTSGRFVQREGAERGRAPNQAARDVQAGPNWNRQNPYIVSGASSSQKGHRLLDVEIPDVTMERYSIMFGNLLRPRPASLLARRQATLGKLKPINDAVPEEYADLVRPRRATSPQPKSSPSFNLFPSASGRPETPQRLSPRMRSNTSPALLPSPARETFQKPVPRKGPSKVEIGASPSKNVDQRETSSSSSVQRDHPLPLSKFHRAAQSVSVSSPAPLTESPTSIEPQNEIHITANPRPTFTEPAWEMVPGPASITSTSPTLSRKQSPASSTSSEQTNETKPTDDGELDKALNEAVEVSIARQISVSRQQRRMLGPFKAGRRKDASPGGVGITTGTAKIAIGSNERLAETKSSTPTIVHPGAEDSPQSIQSHRKSSRVVLEGA